MTLPHTATDWGHVIKFRSGMNMCVSQEKTVLSLTVCLCFARKSVGLIFVACAYGFTDVAFSVVLFALYSFTIDYGLNCRILGHSKHLLEIAAMRLRAKQKPKPRSRVDTSRRVWNSCMSRSKSVSEERLRTHVASFFRVITSSGWVFRSYSIPSF